MPRGVRKEQRIPDSWLVEHYPHGTITDTLDAIEREFGWRPTKPAIYIRASKLGLHKSLSGCGEHRYDRAERIARWSKMPVEDAWMREHDHGQYTSDLSDEFHAEFGWHLTRGQIAQWRASNGRRSREGRGGRNRVPVGTERRSKDGYWVVKVREEAAKPMSKDNWKLKHVHVWEQLHGPLPEGYVVYFADKDKDNFAPDNLVAIPRKYAGVINAMGIEYHDAESLRVALAAAMVKSKAFEVAKSMTVTCGCCGKSFTVSRDEWKRYNGVPRTCPKCLDAGHRSNGKRGNLRFDRDRILALVDEGMSMSQVAREVGCSVTLVSRIVAMQRGDAT